jgi:hypothetical protein
MKAIRGIDGLVTAATIVTVVTIATAAIGARGTIAAREAVPEPPRRLSETGLYANGTLTIDPRNRAYSPQYPLWSDGAGKSRWVYLPAGSVIDASNVDAWDFPVGTKFWKEFEFDGRRVETRLLWKAATDAWVFAAYAWNDDQTDAIVTPNGLRNAATVAPGATHTIPSVDDCRACHDSARIEILGFNALQLSTDRDPNAPHAEALAPGMVTLQTLVDEGLIRPLPGDLVANPPRIRAKDPVARAALGYLSANCGHCHNRESLLAPLGLFMKHSTGTTGEEMAVASSVGRATLWQIPNAPEDATRAIEPGVPELSAVWHRMRSRRPSSQMPPLGTALVDEEAVRLIEAWIGSMARAQLTQAAR